MRRVFAPGEPHRVPDGTLVAPFLNPLDSTSGLPGTMLGGMSLAAGTIPARSASRIHLLPFVTQVTWVRSGTLTVWMKGPDDPDPYRLEVASGRAIVTAPRTFLQLVNEGAEPCDVLYIASPAFLFETAGDRVVYDDAVAVDLDWDQLRAEGWLESLRLPTEEARRAAEHRLRAPAAPVEGP